MSEELEKFRDAALEQFDAGVSGLGDSNERSLTREIGWLQTELEQIYRFVVLLQRDESSMERAAELWASMISICDAFARRVSSLAQMSPSAKISYDRILDLRRAAAERYDLHAL